MLKSILQPMVTLILTSMIQGDFNMPNLNLARATQNDNTRFAENNDYRIIEGQNAI